MSDDKFLEADKELAELLGYTNVRQTKFYKERLSGVMSVDEGRDSFARWTQDDASAFRLAVQYECFPKMYALSIVVEKLQYSTREIQEYYSVAELEDFPDKLSAVRFAIVQAVINKLKETQ